MAIFANLDQYLSGKREGKIFQPRIQVIFKAYRLLSGEKLEKSKLLEKRLWTHKKKIRCTIFGLEPHIRALGPQNREKSRFLKFPY